MADDARISTAIRNHPKTRKLQKRLGKEGVLSLIWLFLYAAESQPDGNLVGMSDEDIELACDWDGGDGKFVAALVDVRFLDGDSGNYQIHDWAEHNPWAATRGIRVAAARRAANAKWDAVRTAMQREQDAGRMRSASETQQSAMPTTPHHTTTPESKTTTKRASQFPSDFKPNEGNTALAKRMGVDLDEAVAAFKDFHESKGNVFKDWNLALNTWIRNDKKYEPKGKAIGNDKPDLLEQIRRATQ